MNDPTTAVPSSVLAFVTTIHAAMLVLRLHRGRMPGVLLLALPSLVLAGMPWVLPTLAGLLAGLAAHAAWFLACEWLVPVPRPAPLPKNADRATPRTARPSVTRVSTAPAGDGGFVDVPVLAVHEETGSIRTFRLARPTGFSFKAGQFLTLRVHADGRALTRCYSVSSSPDTPGYLEISVKRQGLVSNLLHATLRPGGTLAIRPPAGPFVYPDADDRPMVLVAGGIGITPLLSMLRHAVGAEPARPVTLLYSVRSHGDIAFADELALIGRRHPRARIVVTVTGEAAVDLYRHGRVDAALVREIVPDPCGSIFLMCGPLAMIDATRALLHGLGVPAGQVRSEAFAAAVASASAYSVQPADSSGAGEGVSAAATVLDTRVRVVFSKSRQAVEAARDETLLEAAERAGVGIPSMCRAGACGTCRTRMTSGDAHCSSDLLHQSERDEGWVLPCVTHAAGDCVLEA